MGELINDAEFTLSGAYGELYYVDPIGLRLPRRVLEVTNFRAGKQGSSTAIAIAGNRQGKKRGPVTNSGEFTVRVVDAFFKRLAAEQLGADDDERRAQRDAGTRRRSGWIWQAWIDDPEGLGKLGYQFEGVTVDQWQFGFDITQVATSDTYQFDFLEVRTLEEFEKVGNEVEAATGMPAVQVITPDS